VLLGITIPVIAAVAYWFSGTTVALSVAQYRPIEERIEETAIAKSSNEQTIYAECNGVVKTIFVDAGDQVKEESALVLIDNTGTRLEAEKAEAEEKAAKARIDSTQIDNYKNLIAIREAELSIAQVVESDARREFDNANALYNAGAVPKDDVDKARSGLEAAEQATRSARFALAEQRKGSPSYVKNEYQAQQRASKASTGLAQLNLTKSFVAAPMDAVILEKYIEPNTYVSIGTPLFRIGGVGNAKLESNILADDIFDIKVGNRVEISGGVVGDKTLPGRVVKIAPYAKSMASSLGVNQRRILVTIELSDTASRIPAGAEVDVDIITAENKRAIVVPDTAVFDYKGSHYVFKVIQRRARLQEVQLGIESDDTVEILQGLKPGDIVLKSPGNTIRDGARVKGESNGS